MSELMFKLAVECTLAILISIVIEIYSNSNRLNDGKLIFRLFSFIISTLVITGLVFIGLGIFFLPWHMS